MDRMTTYTGKRIPALSMKPEDVDILDIAHPLSLMCRGGGQIRFFFSVAQHSINCAYEALARGYSNRVVLATLLHDASEAYISDIIRPVKMHLPVYYEIEDRIMKAILIYAGLGDLSKEEREQVRAVDDDMLTVELNMLFSIPADMEMAKLESSPVLEQKNFEEVEEQFLKLYEEFTAQMNTKE